MKQDELIREYVRLWEALYKIASQSHDCGNECKQIAKKAITPRLITEEDP